MDKRIFPITEQYFNKDILPIIEQSYIWKGRPPKISHYKIFCAILYILRTGDSWRDLPPIYGPWNAVYLRFKRGSDRGLWWKILTTLQHRNSALINIVIIDSTTVKIHRHGGGAKKGNIREA